MMVDACFRDPYVASVRLHPAPTLLASIGMTSATLLGLPEFDFQSARTMLLTAIRESLREVAEASVS